MNYIYCTLGFLFLLLFIFNYLDKLKTKYLKKGYESGEKAVLENMVHNSYWLNQHTEYYNFLQYYSMKYRKLGRVPSETLRNDLEIIKQDKRITDFSNEELKHLI